MSTSIHWVLSHIYMLFWARNTPKYSYMVFQQCYCEKSSILQCWSLSQLAFILQQWKWWLMGNHFFHTSHIPYTVFTKIPHPQQKLVFPSSLFVTWEHKNVVLQVVLLRFIVWGSPITRVTVRFTSQWLLSDQRSGNASASLKPPAQSDLHGSASNPKEQFKKCSWPSGLFAFRVSNMSKT